MGTRENKFESSEDVCKHRQNFIIDFTSTFKCFTGVQHSFSTFSVARNDFFEKIFKNDLQNFVILCEYKLGSRFLSTCYSNFWWILLRWLKAVSSTFQDVGFDVSLLPLVITWWYNHGIRKLPNHWWTRWYHLCDTIGYHSNTMTC